MRPVDEHVKNRLTRNLENIGVELDADVIAFVSPVLPGLELGLRDAIDRLSDKKQSVAVILDTPGGVVEVVERMVAALRFVYEDVTMIVPDRAMSAGTIFALSADRIMMDHLSCLGPIDPQIEKDGKLVPALSYLNQFERLNKKSRDGQLTTVEYMLLDKLDLGELYQFKQARELSVELLIKWLSRYKFKNWNETETKRKEVSPSMKADRAKEIAALLNNPERWHSHGRAIDRGTLQEEVGLKIDNLEEYPKLYGTIRDYFALLKDYMYREKISNFIHAKEYF